MNADLPDWFRAAVGEGLQRLIALSLPGCPPSETIKLTAQAWAEALWSKPIKWDENLDSQRLKEAFISAGRQCDRWPAPKQVLDEMRPRLMRKKLPEPPVSDQQRRINRARIRLMLKKTLKHG